MSPSLIIQSFTKSALFNPAHSAEVDSENLPPLTAQKTTPKKSRILRGPASKFGAFLRFTKRSARNPIPPAELVFTPFSEINTGITLSSSNFSTYSFQDPSLATTEAATDGPKPFARSLSLDITLTDNSSGTDHFISNVGRTDLEDPFKTPPTSPLLSPISFASMLMVDHCDSDTDNEVLPYPSAPPSPSSPRFTTTSYKQRMVRNHRKTCQILGLEASEDSLKAIEASYS